MVVTSSLAAFLLAALIATNAAGQPKKETASASYPDKPIRRLVPFTPAGTADILVRMVARKLGERCSQQVVIDNRAGSAGIIGTEIAAKARTPLRSSVFSFSKTSSGLRNVEPFSSSAISIN